MIGKGLGTTEAFSSAFPIQSTLEAGAKFSAVPAILYTGGEDVARRCTQTLLWPEVPRPYLEPAVPAE